MKGVRLPNETIADIKALRAKGHSISEIQALTKVRGRGTVSRHVQGIALPFGPLKRGSKRRVAANACRRLKADGLTYRAIATRLGCGLATVHRILNTSRGAA